MNAYLEKKPLYESFLKRVLLLRAGSKPVQSHRLPMMPTDERAIIPMRLVHRAGEHREWNRQLPAPTPTPPPVPPVPAIG